MNCISVIIPCYNDGLYIMDAIESVRCQTYPSIELVVIDDGSTDPATKEILHKIEASGIKVLYTNHAGPAAARNLGISAATGCYILPLDADDKIAPTYIEKAISILEANQNIGVVYCYAELFGEKKGRWDLPDYTLSRMLQDNIVFVTSVFYRKDWEAVGGFCEDLVYGMEDYDFWLSILELGREIYQIPEVLFWYRIKPVSRTTKLNDDIKKMQLTYQSIFDNHKKLYQQNYDIVIPALRDAWLEQIYMRKKTMSALKVLNSLLSLPLVKKAARWIIRKI